MFIKSLFIVFILSIAILADSRAIYGKDERIDASKLNPYIDTEAYAALQSICLIIPKEQVYKSAHLDENNKHRFYIKCPLNALNVKDKLSYLFNEQYSNAPAPSFSIDEKVLMDISGAGGTGFLVADDVILTNEHVVSDRELEDFVCIFGYYNDYNDPVYNKIRAENLSYFKGYPLNNISTSETFYGKNFIKLPSTAEVLNVTSCIVKGEYYNGDVLPDRDFALLYIDNTDRPALKIADYELGDAFNLAHGEGQPLKYGAGDIKEIFDLEEFLKTENIYDIFDDFEGDMPRCMIYHTIDTKAGTSGSPIFNSAGEVTAINLGSSYDNGNYLGVGEYKTNDYHAYYDNYSNTYTIYENIINEEDQDIYNLAIAISENSILYDEIKRILKEQGDGNNSGNNSGNNTGTTGTWTNESSGSLSDYAGNPNITWINVPNYNRKDLDIESNYGFGLRGTFFYQDAPSSEVTNGVRYAWNYNTLSAIAIASHCWDADKKEWGDDGKVDRIEIDWGDNSESRYYDYKYKHKEIFAHTYPDDEVKTYTIKMKYIWRRLIGWEIWYYEEKTFQCHPKKLVYDNPIIGIPAALF